MEPVNPKQVTVLWHGWLKKLGGFSKRWKRRYFVFLSTASGMKELRHYDTQKDVNTLLGSTPKGVIALTDATGICCFLPPSPSAVLAKKHTVFNLIDSHDTNASDIQDQKFAILTPLHVHLLAFQSGREWANASESQQGLSLLASLSAFYSTIDVLHSGMMSKKRERTGHSAAKHSIISYWKRHFFVYLSSGDLLYFKDETLAEFQGRVDVRHAPTVRVTGERMLEERKKEIGSMLMKLAKLPGTGNPERENCLVWIATPPSKVFVLKLQEDHEGVSADGRRQELTSAAKKWLSLLLQGHAETKYTQLEQCISMGKFDTTAEVISAVRAGIPDELRGPMWKGLSGAADLQRRNELKRTIRKVTKTFSIRSLSATKDEGTTSIASETLYEEMSGALDSSSLHDPEGRMILSRFCAITMSEMRLGSAARLSSSRAHKNDTKGDDQTDVGTDRSLFPIMSSPEEGEDALSDSGVSSPLPKNDSTKEKARDKTGHHVYPNETPAPAWEVSARRRLLVAISRFSPFSHPCPWKVLCLLLAYLEEESAFWVINSIQDVYLPGYYHGYRPALQVDVAVFKGMLEERTPTLYAHLNGLSFPFDQTAERWFLSMFTSTYLPLPTVLRIWDAFFAKGIRVLFGVGLALFLRAEDKLFRAKSCSEVHEILSVTERTSVDADALFSHALKDDLNISWLAEERFDKIRARYRQRMVDTVATELNLFKEKLSILSLLQDHITRILNTVKRLTSVTKRNPGQTVKNSSPLSPFRRANDWSFMPAEGDAFGDNDENDIESLTSSLITLQGCLRYAEDSVAKAASELNTRQAKWLALSSQLVGCPVTRGTIRLSTDLQSWLLQVKEGKISGAGIDALPTHNADFPLQLAEHQGLFFDSDEGEVTSCLVSHRNDFQSDEDESTDGFLHALVSTIKAACAVRLECIGSANRFDWLGGRWLQSSISYPADVQSGFNRARSSSRSLRRSVSNANNPVFAASTSNSRRNPRPLAIDVDRSTSRNSLDDSVLRRWHGTELELGATTVMAPVEEQAFDPFGSSRGAIMGGSTMYMDYDSTYHSAMPTSHNPPPSSTDAGDVINPFVSWQNQAEDFAVSADDSRVYQQLSAQYRQSEQTIHSCIDSIMSCFSRFIRLDSHHPSKPQRVLRHRAVLLEEDLLQELKEVDAIAVSSKDLV